MGIDGRELGRQFEGLARLAMVGLVAIMAAIPAGIAALGLALWWAWNHVAIK